MRARAFEQAEVRIYPDADALSRAAADEWLRAADSAITMRGQFTVALPGGSTPRSVLRLIAADVAEGRTSLSWDDVQIFFGDERYVPADHVDSNYRMAHETLLSKVPIPARHIHRVHTDLDAPAAAMDYERRLRTVFGCPGIAVPRFDLIWLGLGEDGHTASLFPGSPVLREHTVLVAADWVDTLSAYRITFTYPLLNNAATVLFVAGGSAKAPMLRQALLGDPAGPASPAQRVRPTDGRLLWLVDEAAASAL